MQNPNLLVFFTDQQRWDTLGVNGNPDGLTPHLDRLARQGTFFECAVTPQPVCGPARSCLQTGQYATTTGVHCNGRQLKPDAPKLAELCQQAGYHTAYLGKWHLSEGTGPGAVPADRRAGYREWLAANCVELVSGPYSARLYDEDDQPHQLPGYRSDALTDAAVRFLDRRSQTTGEPFLLSLSYLEPHHQNTDDSYPAPHGMERTYADAWLPPDLRALGGSAPRDWAGYCAMIKRLDDNLGRILDALESTGQAENTVVVCLSDHGCHFKTRNDEYKRSPHESSVRVPLVFGGPGWQGGGLHRRPVSLVDVMPSLLESAGIPTPREVEGHSLLPLTRGIKPEALPDHAYIQFGDMGMPPGRALHTGRWKYAVTAGDAACGQADAASYEETHLYDLQTDPYELSNLITSPAHQEIRENLRRAVLERAHAIGEPPAIIQTAEPGDGFAQRTIDYP